MTIIIGGLIVVVAGLYAYCGFLYGREYEKKYVFWRKNADEWKELAQHAAAQTNKALELLNISVAPTVTQEEIDQRAKKAGSI